MKYINVIHCHQCSSYCKQCLQTVKTNQLLKRFIVLFVVFSAFHMQEVVRAAPQGPLSITPDDPGAVFDPDLAGQLVFQDDDGNIYFDFYSLRGKENKISYAKNRVLVVTIQAPDEVQDTFEKELWKFITSILGVTSADLEILMFPMDAGRRVLLKKGKITVRECQEKIKDILKPYIPLPGQTPGQTEPPPLLQPYDQLAIYAQNDTNQKPGPLKYYEVSLPKEKSGKRLESIPRKKLVEMKPYYGKDPSWMAKILRDLRPNKEVVFRGRLLPGTPLRPILDDYRGPRKVKMVRRILEGIADGSGVRKSEAKLRFEMSHPVPALMMLDYLSPDKTSVVSRRVISPLFRNETLDLAEELEYTEVV